MGRRTWTTARRGRRGSCGPSMDGVYGDEQRRPARCGSARTRRTPARPPAIGTGTRPTTTVTARPRTNPAWASSMALAARAHDAGECPPEIWMKSALFACLAVALSFASMSACTTVLGGFDFNGPSTGGSSSSSGPGTGGRMTGMPWPRRRLPTPRRRVRRGGLHRRVLRSTLATDTKCSFNGGQHCDGKGKCVECLVPSECPSAVDDVPGAVLLGRRLRDLERHRRLHVQRQRRPAL